MYINYIVTFLNIFFDLLSFAILARVLLSWMPMQSNRAIDILKDVTDPILNLAKRITPNLGMIDLSPIIAIFGLDLFRTLIFILLGAK